MVDPPSLRQESQLSGRFAVAERTDDLVEALIETGKVGIGHAPGDRRVEEVAGEGTQRHLRLERTGQFDRHRNILAQIVDTRAAIPLLRQDVPGETHLADEAPGIRYIEDI